jgi:hypothetical protein
MCHVNVNMFRLTYLSSTGGIHGKISSDEELPFMEGCGLKSSTVLAISTFQHYIYLGKPP